MYLETLPSSSTVVAYRVEHESNDYDDYDEFCGYRRTLEEAQALRHSVMEGDHYYRPSMCSMAAWERYVRPHFTISPVTVA